MINKDITNKLKKTIDDTIPSIFDLNNIKKYLKVNSKLFYMPYYNLVLFYIEDYDVEMVAGYHSWNKYFNRTVLKGERPIKVLYPNKIHTTKGQTLKNSNMEVKYDKDGNHIKELKDFDILDFNMGYLFDISQTDNPVVDINIDVNIEDVLRGKYEFNIGYYEKSIINNNFKNYIVDISEKEIGIVDDLSPEEEQEALIKGYIEYKFLLTDDIQDSEIKKQMVNYVVLSHFKLNTDYITFPFINKFSEDKELSYLKQFLDDIQLISNEIIQDFIGNFFSFDEVNIINQLLDFENKDAFMDYIKEMMNNLTIDNEFDFLEDDEKLLHNRLSNILNKVSKLTDEEYTEIFIDRLNRKILSQPFYFI